MCLLCQLLSKVTDTSCSFYMKCSMCLPCCWTTYSSWRRHWLMARSMKRCDISEGSVATYLTCDGNFSDSIITNIVFSWFRQWNNFENRLIFGKVKTYPKIARNFLGYRAGPNQKNTVFVIILSVKFSSHFKCVATLSC